MAGIPTPIDRYFEHAAMFAVDTYNRTENVDLEFEKFLWAWRFTETEAYLILIARDHDGCSKTYAAYLDAGRRMRKFEKIFDTAPPPSSFTETEDHIIPQGRDHSYPKTYEANVHLGAGGGVMTKVENITETKPLPGGYRYQRSTERQYHSTSSDCDDSKTYTYERHEEDGSASVTITATRGSASVTTATRGFDRMKLLK